MEWPLSGCQSIVVSPKAVLGPVLFIIYINDIDLGLDNFITKFADNAKVGNAVLPEGNRQSLQDLRKISDWSVNWEMHFNININLQFCRLDQEI